MKNLKYVLILIMGAMASSCNEEPVFRDVGDDDDEPIHIPPPPSRMATPIDSLTNQ